MFIIILPKVQLTSHSRFVWLSVSDHIIVVIWDMRTFFFFFTVLCILATSPYYLLLGPYHFCPLLCPSLHEIFPQYLILLKRSLVSPILLFSSIYLHCSVKTTFLLIFGTLHSDRHIFPFILCLSFLFFLSSL